MPPARSHLAFLISTLSLLSCTPQREVKQYTIEQFMNTTSIFGSSLSHDDSLVLFSGRKTGVYNAFTVDVGGGEPAQLTNSTTNSFFAISFFPDDNRILYSSDQGGNELSRIYLRSADGAVRDLTPDTSARAQFYGWSHDRKSFFFGSNKRDPRFLDLYEMDITAFVPTMIYRNDRGLDVAAISNDKRYLALLKSITEHNNEMYLYDLDARETKHISRHTGDVTYSPETFSVDSKSLYYLTDEGREFAYLKRHDIASGTSDTNRGGSVGHYVCEPLP